MAVATRQPSIQAFVQKAWHRLRTSTCNFFFAPDGQETGDHLVEVVRRDPEMAKWFIELTSMFSILGSLAAAIACGIFLNQHWNRCGKCGRPLRWWLVGQVCLQMSQIPIRAVLFASIQRISRNWTIENCIVSLTSSPAWRISKMVSLVLYGWFVLGVVWWMHSSDCEDCPGISMLIASVLLLSAARTALTLLASRELFGTNLQAVQVAAPQVEAATRCQIRVLPLVRVAPSSVECQTCLDSSADTGERLHQRCGSGAPQWSTCHAGEKCAVCLCDFDAGDMVRRLPCVHHFHPACIDRWLSQNKRCPLCMHPIDQVCQTPRLKSE